MKRLLRKNRRLQERLTKTKKRIVKTIQLFNAATLQQMNEEKKKKEQKNDKCRREVDEERKNEENCKRKILEEEKEFRYDDVRDRRREELECSDFHDVLY